MWNIPTKFLLLVSNVSMEDVNQTIKMRKIILCYDIDIPWHVVSVNQPLILMVTFLCRVINDIFKTMWKVLYLWSHLLLPSNILVFCTKWKNYSLSTWANFELRNACQDAFLMQLKECLYTYMICWEPFLNFCMLVCCLLK